MEEYCRYLFFLIAGPTNGQLGWCQLAYWEMGKRVGPLYPVDQPALNVFGNVPHGDGISLHTLAQNNHSPPEVVCRTRNKIGLGKFLFYNMQFLNSIALILHSL